MYKTAKIPTLVGLFLLLIGVGVGVIFVQRENIFNPKAASSETPQDVRITNTNDNSFSVSWTTPSPTNGFISYGETNSVGKVVSQNPNSGTNSYVHYVNVDSLSPNSQYYFKIGSGQSGINKSKLYTVKTGPKLASPREPDIFFGNIFDSKNNPVAGAVVYLTLANTEPFSTLTDNKGHWSVNLAQARNTNLSSYTTYDKTVSLLEIFVQSGNNKFASASIKTASAHPVPNLTLGSIQDFTNLKPVLDNSVPQSDLEVPLQTTTASPTPSPSPISGFSSRALPKPSPTPSLAPSPKPLPTPNSVSTSVKTTPITAKDTLLSAGNLTTTLFVFIMGLVIVVIGLFVPQTA